MQKRRGGWKAMDSETFSREVIPIRDRMFRLAKSMLSDHAEAEDAVHDVMEKLWLRRDTLSGYDNLGALVMVSVRNTCLDRIRSRKTRAKGNEAVRQSARAWSDERVAIETRDLGRMAAAIIASLPEKQRVIIHLRDVEGYPMEEIARIAGMELPAVRMALSRARKAVREQLQKIMDYGNR